MTQSEFIPNVNLIKETKDISFFKQSGTTPIEAWYFANMLCSTNFTADTLGLAVNKLYTMPAIFTKKATIDKIRIECTTANAGGKVRIGIYLATSYSNLYPKNLVLDAGELDTSTTGVKTLTVSQDVFPGNLYYFAIMINNNVSSVSALSGFSTNGNLAVLGTNDGSFVPHTTDFVQVSQTYGAMPDPYPLVASPSIFQGFIPIIMYHLS